MSDIYQQIWDADQAGAGVRPILDTEAGDPATGFVKVSTDLDSRHADLRVLPEVEIPVGKRRTYDLCRELFDNYALRERDHENDTPEEREEVHDLVHAMVDSPPMEVARDFVARATGTSLTRERWYNTITEMWFRRFSMGGDPHLTGFEHVVVGEQQGAKAQGYHFWYKYYLDDGLARELDGSHDFPGLQDDRIEYLGSRLTSGQRQFPETVTISYKWHAPDYDRKAIRPLTKPTGGFFVGCSVEGLLALGSVRAHVGARAPKEAVINGARYDMRMFRSEDNRNVRTFYPKFLGAVPVEREEPRREQPERRQPEPRDPGRREEPVVVIPSQPTVRIIAAQLNPEGHDPGRESVTIINTGRSDQQIGGWSIVDKNRRSMTLPAETLAAGHTKRIVLDPSGPQLSNKGGRIDLYDEQDRRVHSVTYSRGQARTDGITVVF